MPALINELYLYLQLMDLKVPIIFQLVGVMETLMRISKTIKYFKIVTRINRVIEINLKFQLRIFKN